MIRLAIALQLADLATFAIAATGCSVGRCLDVAQAEQNPLMVAAFMAFGLAGVATLKIALIGVALRLRLRIKTRTRRWGTALIAAGGLVGTSANIIAMVTLG